LGWRGLLLPRLYAIRPWVAFVIGGLIWYAWHLPLNLVIPQEAIAFAVPQGSAPGPGEVVWLGDGLMRSVRMLL
jgi:membrane protease YdiL (CAAX protease family)